MLRSIFHNNIVPVIIVSVNFHTIIITVSAIIVPPLLVNYFYLISVRYRGQLTALHTLYYSTFCISAEIMVITS